MEIFHFVSYLLQLLSRLWRPPPPVDDVLELVEITRDRVIARDNIPRQPPEGTIELHYDASDSSFTLAVCLRPGAYCSTTGRTTLSAQWLSDSDGRHVGPSISLHFMIRASVTPLPGRGTEYILHSIPLRENPTSGHTITRPLTGIIVWNVVEERDAHNAPLHWTVTVNGEPPESWSYGAGILRASRFSADLNGMVTVTLRAG